MTLDDACKAPTTRDDHAPGRAKHAMQILRSIALCNAYIERGNDVHALTAALMLPCYQAEFRSLALEMNEVEGRELRAGLAAWPVAINPNIPPASAGAAPCPATRSPVPARPT